MTALGEQTDMGKRDGKVAAVTGGARGVSDWVLSERLLLAVFSVPAKVA